MDRIRIPRGIASALDHGENAGQPRFGFDNRIDFAVMERRAAVWNPYAESVGLCKIGSVRVGTAPAGQSGVFMVVDFLPKGYRGNDGDEPTLENRFVVLDLHMLDLPRFAEDGRIGFNYTRTTGLFRQTEHDDFRKYIAGLDAELTRVKKAVVGKVVLARDSVRDFWSYCLMKVDDVKRDPASGQYWIYQDGGFDWLHIGNNGGTYRYFDWKYEKLADRLYLEFDSDGKASASSVGFNVLGADGMFVNTGLAAYQELRGALRKCGGLNEEFYPDPFRSTFEECMKYPLDVRLK